MRSAFAARSPSSHFAHELEKRRRLGARFARGDGPHRRGVLATDNAQQVTKAVRILAEMALQPATPAEAREILGLKGGDLVSC